MVLEFCKKKTKCSECGKTMEKGDIRQATGGNGYYDPLVYKCESCFIETGFPINDLIKIYKERIKEYNKKILFLKSVKKELKK